MSRKLKRILATVGGAAALLLLVALIAPRFLNFDRHKPRLEAAASDALGMDVRVDGRVGMGFFPSFHVTLERGRILGERGADVASAGGARLFVDLLPLLREEFRLRRIDLTKPTLSIERDSAGSVNVERLKKAVALLGGLDGGSVTLKNGTLRYVDRRSGGGFEATGIDLSVTRIRLAGGRSPLRLNDVSLRAALTCAEIRAKSVSGSALKVAVEGKDGVFVAEPLTMSLFGGRGNGSMRADFTDRVPSHRFRGTLANFRVEESLKMLSPIKAAEGEMSFSMDLSAQGGSRGRVVETVAGNLSLRGRDLTLLNHDLDGAISRFEASQNFNLVDVGAVFLTGPLGLAVTKGYSFAGLFQGTGGSTKLGTVVSDWTVERGVARAKDVAMTTPKNRLAVQGGLDFVGRRFDDMTLAVVDEDGCSTLRQTIRGSFDDPDVDKPHVLTSLAGPLVSALKKAIDILPTGPCDVFYSGSVKHPNQEPETDQRPGRRPRLEGRRAYGASPATGIPRRPSVGSGHGRAGSARMVGPERDHEIALRATGRRGFRRLRARPL